MMKGNAAMSHLPNALIVAALAGWLTGVGTGSAQPVDLSPGAPPLPRGACVPYVQQPQYPSPVVTYTPPAAPTRTYALLPGHWELRGANYVWVPPERVLRPVQTGSLTPGRYVWRDGAYVWMPAHYN